MPFLSPGSPVLAPVAAEVLAALFEVSLTGVALLRPLYAPDDPARITDWAYVQLNPAAQRMLQLPECPAESFLTLNPGAVETGIFALQCAMFRSGESSRHDVNYQHEGLDNYYHFAGRRSGELLVLSFTDTADQDRSAVELALRAAQAREQAALAIAEARRAELAQLFEQAPVAVALFEGPRHVVQLANPAVLRMWGRTRAQTIGTPLFELLPEAAGQGFEELLAGVLATGVPYVAHELPALIDREGHRDTVYWNFVYLPRRDTEGQITGVTVVATDVSEQVQARLRIEQLNQDLARTNTGLADTVAARTRQLAQAQAATEAQRQRLHRLIAEAPALIASLRGPDHEVELANDRFRRMFGGRELVGKPYREAVPDLTGQPFFDRLDAVYRTGETYFGTDELMALDRTNSGRSEQFYASYTYQATRDAAGQVDGILIFAAEVTDQVLARQERETQRQQLEELFMQAPAPIVILDGPSLVFELVNPAYQRIFPGRALRGQPLLAAMPELVGTAIPDLFAHVYRTGESYVAQEMPLMMTRHVGGPLEAIHWTFTYQARRDGHGAINGVFVFAHDVTDQVRTRQLIEDNHQQVQRLNQDLATANAGLTSANGALGHTNHALTRTNGELDNFVYTASHDLKAPITNIEGLLTALREDLGPAAAVSGVAHLLALMRGAVERFKRTLDDLTDIAKLHAAHHAPATAVDLAALVEGVRLDLAPLLAATGGQLTVDVAPCPGLAFAEKNLRSVVYNLLSNALKYRHPDRVPHVRLRCRTTPAATVLEVHDNGLGLDSGQQARLFGLFQRLHDHVEGSGVGLYMVKKIVEGVGGYLEVESQPGVGSTFRVFLPR